jgi:hypothetical protein
LIGLGVLVARRWDSIAHPQFIYEDAAAFWAPTFIESVPDLILRPWAGFLQVGPRLIFLLARITPSAIAPAVAELALLAAIALLSIFLVSDRLEGSINSKAARTALAAFLFLIPSTSQTLGSALNVDWFLWIYLVFLSMASRSRGVTNLVEGLLAVVAALSGPAVIALIPVLILRLRGTRPKLLLALIICAAVQLVTYVVSSRRPAPTSGVVESVYAFLRQSGASVIGTRFGHSLDDVAFPWLLAAIGLLVIVGALFCARNLPRQVAATLVWAALIAGVAGLISVGAPRLQSPGQNGRYFLVMATFVAAAAAVSMNRRSSVGLVLGAMIIIGCVGDFAVEALPPGAWALQHDCIGGPNPCRLDVYPPIWSVEWPGIGGTYKIPVGITPDGGPLY